ncbi:unnamed protein product [Clonostachys byssicola]|uniref:Metallo-beta-lactamase domain-containing protein n=1 Tax=Clonostachys byssicola TaxID=160290 RepID=A0A9N9TY30_9HYPO|nr:unnamed protein product [Clonostachys byssicola]
MEPGDVAITFLSTGKVKIKTSMKSQPIDNKNAILRRMRSFFDRTWSDELPVGVFLISHPDGPILFDTGESPLCNDPGYHSMLSTGRFFAQTVIRKDEGIVSQLKAQGIVPESLQAIVLSHLHGDHAGGLPSLLEEAPDVPVYTTKEHWDAFGNSPIHATINGCAPQHWPKNFKPRILEKAQQTLGPWASYYPITKDASIVAVDTPGHVPGHISLIACAKNENQDPTNFFLVGDATYSIEDLDSEQPDGINDDPETAFRSLQQIKQYARLHDVVMLPSHDPNTPEMLNQRTVYRPTDRNKAL